MIARQPVGQLWLAGVFPGLLMAAMFVIYIVIRCWLQPNLAPALPPEERTHTLREKFALARASVAPLAIFISMTGIFLMGYASLVESAAFGAVAETLAAIAKGRLKADVMETTLRKTPVFISNQDRELRYTWVRNPPPQIAADHIIGRRDEDVFPESAAEAVVAAKRTVMDTGAPARIELVLEKDREQRWFDVGIDPLLDERGNIAGVTTVALDVTHRKRAEEHLKGLLREVTHRAKNMLAVVSAISRQTVYDALAALAEHGLVRRIQPAGSSARYEGRVGDNHHHVVCRSCGQMVDVDCAVGYTPCLTAADAAGYEIDEAEVIYWGRCPECMAEVESAGI